MTIVFVFFFVVFFWGGGGGGVKLRHYCEFEKCTEVTETRNGKLVFNTHSAMAVILGPNTERSQ